MAAFSLIGALACFAWSLYSPTFTSLLMMCILGLSSPMWGIYDKMGEFNRRFFGDDDRD